MAEMIVTAIETRGVSAQKPFHAGYRVGPRGFNDYMKVVAHYAIGVDLPSGFGAGLTESFQQKLAVLVAGEDVFAAITAVHDMVPAESFTEARKLAATLARFEKK